MKIIKKIIQGAILASMILLVQNVQAQRGGHHKGGQMLDKMKTELDLTAEQEAKIDAIQEKYRPQIEALKVKEFEDRSEKRAAFGEIMKAQKEEVSQVLTDDQKATLKEKRDQHRPHHKRNKAENKEMRQEMKTYKAANIQPVILQQRAKLEQDISAEDKASIVKLRAAFQQMKEEKIANKKEFAKGKDKNKDADREDRRAQKKEQKEALKEKYKAESALLKTLSEKYSEKIEALQEEIKPQQEQWKKDMKDIHEKYAATSNEMNQDAPKKDKLEHRKRHGKKHKKGHHKGEMGHHAMGKKHFLLLDPNEAVAPSTATTSAFTILNTFPNPATSNNTLSYKVTKATRIKIALTDESGNVLKVLVNEFKEVGDYQKAVDLSNLKNGAYYYTVTDNGGISTKKLIVNNK